MTGDIAFSQVREDPRVDEEVVGRVAARLGRPVRVLMIASGGCTALGLLARAEVERIVAVDASLAQLHLVELRRCATVRLPLVPGGSEEQLRFLGAEGGDPEARRATYARLAAHLPAATRAHWDARADEIGAGVLHVGRFEALFRELARALAEAGLEPLARPEEAIASPRWRDVFERVFEREALAGRFGPAAVDYSMDRSFGEHFADVVARALERWGRAGDRGGSYFLHQMLEGRYLQGPGGRPPCLEAEVQAAAIARGVERLELAHGALDEVVRERAAAGERFDVVHTSNVSDWMPVPALVSLLERVRALLSPGGALIARRLNGDHDLAEVVGRVLDVDVALSSSLRQADRSFFYREVVVADRAGGEA